MTSFLSPHRFTPRRFSLVFVPLLATLLLPAIGCRSEAPTAEPVEQESEAAPDDAATTADGPPTASARQLLAARLDPDRAASGWVRLFDGHTFFGWQQIADVNWRIEDNSLTADEGDVGLICTTVPWQDYELTLEFNAAEGTNSGIFLRTPPAPDDPTKECYELNIAPTDNPFPTGSLVGRQRVEPVTVGPITSDKWHRYDVRVEGDRVTVSLDGKEIVDWTDPEPLPAGLIGLQHNSGRIAFRDIQLRPLGMQSLLDADLSQWKQYPDMEGSFEIETESEQPVLHVTGGRGQLETRDQWGDFAMLARYRTNSENLNSGIFFRCIPGDQMMGYECQISNAMKEGNPLLPADCGTGGIFRRQDARIIAGEDGAYTTVLLKAAGPNMAAWVRGLQVSDWTDTREPDPNPRKGLRLEPGTIMIQAHDPTTDVTFSDIAIASRDGGVTSSESPSE